MKFWEEGLRYRRGCEEDAGDWQPEPIGSAANVALTRCSNAFIISPHCDSPIEVQLGAAIILFFDQRRLPINLIPQFAWSYYRSDWAIVTANDKTLLIECDGREFHSSDEQLKHDARKDAAAVARGYRTIRFTGSQIHRDPDACAQIVFDHVCSL